MARRPKVEEPENHERWLVSYADFITLLFAFFVVMYAISSVNEGKYKVLSQALVEAFSSPERSTDPIQIGEIARSNPLSFIELEQGQGKNSQQKDPQEAEGEEPPTFEEQLSELTQIADEVFDELGDLVFDELLDVRESERWLELELKSNVLFPSGSARFNPAALPIIQQVAEIIRPYPNPVHIEGFTDNVPIATDEFPSNWELSSSRAAAVVRLLTRYGVPSDQLAAIGYGEFHPIADNRTEEGRRQNRRVVIVIAKSDAVRHAGSQPSPDITPFNRQQNQLTPGIPRPTQRGVETEI